MRGRGRGRGEKRGGECRKRGEEGGGRRKKLHAHFTHTCETMAGLPIKRELNLIKLTIALSRRGPLPLMRSDLSGGYRVRPKRDQSCP